MPLLNASLTDGVLEVERPTGEAGGNALFKAAAEGELRGILDCGERPLASADYTNDPRSASVDAPSTLVTDGTQVKVLAWYDNEGVCQPAGGSGRADRTRPVTAGSRGTRA